MEWNVIGRLACMLALGFSCPAVSVRAAFVAHFEGSATIVGGCIEKPEELCRKDSLHTSRVSVTNAPPKPDTLGAEPVAFDVFNSEWDRKESDSNWSIIFGHHDSVPTKLLTRCISSGRRIIGCLYRQEQFMDMRRPSSEISERYGDVYRECPREGEIGVNILPKCSEIILTGIDMNPRPLKFGKGSVGRTGGLADGRRLPPNNIQIAQRQTGDDTFPDGAGVAEPFIYPTLWGFGLLFTCFAGASILANKAWEFIDWEHKKRRGYALLVGGCLLGAFGFFGVIVNWPAVVFASLRSLGM